MARPIMFQFETCEATAPVITKWFKNWTIAWDINLSNPMTETRGCQGDVSSTGKMVSAQSRQAGRQLLTRTIRNADKSHESHSRVKLESQTTMILQCASQMETISHVNDERRVQLQGQIALQMLMFTTYKKETINMEH